MILVNLRYSRSFISHFCSPRGNREMERAWTSMVSQYARSQMIILDPQSVGVCNSCIINSPRTCTAARCGSEFTSRSLRRPQTRVGRIDVLLVDPKTCVCFVLRCCPLVNAESRPTSKLQKQICNCCGSRTAAGNKFVFIWLSSHYCPRQERIIIIVYYAKGSTWYKKTQNTVIIHVEPKNLTT